MTGLRRPWALFGLFLVLALGAMGWVTWLALRAERAEVAAQARTLVEERTRLALWRLDSTMALFLAPETARPWHHFETFHREHGAVVPSPMLVMDDPMVLLRFQIEPDGAFRAPLVPDAASAALARQAVEEPRRLGEAAERLEALRGRLGRESLRQAMAAQGAVLFDQAQIQELRDRSRKVALAISSPYEVSPGVWVPLWLGDDLFLARQVWVGGRELFQVTWLDWASVKEILLSAVRDLLPEADVLPVRSGAEGAQDRRMGSMPLRLIPGHLRVQVPGAKSPARAALWLGWVFTLAGAAAVGLALRHALELGERRGIFASAVSHELRTPLTTFRLNAELLARGMVPEAADRQELLDTLLAESIRLDHLVTNILAYARLESGRASSRESLAVGDLLARGQARLMARAQEGGLHLTVDVPETLAERHLSTDPLVVEQILFNLVDNAAKYAAGAGDAHLHLEAREGRRRLVLRVRDHGPGLDPADRDALFQPFRKSVQQAARSAPGVGLGLALCRNLARSLGGDLAFEAPEEGGACFVVSLPLG